MGNSRPFVREAERLQGLPNAKLRRQITTRAKDRARKDHEAQRRQEARQAGAKFGQSFLASQSKLGILGRIKSFLSRPVSFRRKG